MALPDLLVVSNGFWGCADRKSDRTFGPLSNLRRAAVVRLPVGMLLENWFGLGSSRLVGTSFGAVALEIAPDLSSLGEAAGLRGSGTTGL